MINANAMKRIFMISDIHFGVRSNSLEWLEIHKDYFYNFFIPLLKSNMSQGDVLFILGDIFESRQTINILVLNEALNIFKMLAELMPVYIIIGNHDCYKKTSTNINSAIIFNDIPNIKIFNDEEILSVNNGNTKLLMMPWQENANRELEIIKNNNADYLFCHTHFGGIRFNRKVVIEEGLDIAEVSKFKRVYSGHIHYNQIIKNVRMIGCPFQLTRGDILNRKQVVVLDLASGEETIYYNDYSPIFLKYKIDDLLELTHEQFQKFIKNNFVDIIVEGDWVSKFPYAKLIDSLNEYKNIKYILATLQKDYEGEEDTDGDEINIEELTKIYINSLTYTEQLKRNLVEATERLFKKATKLLEEKTQESDML